MTRKWHSPPNWDRHLDEAIEDVNAMGLGGDAIVAVPAEPPRERDENPFLRAFAVAVVAMGISLFMFLARLSWAIWTAQP